MEQKATYMYVEELQLLKHKRQLQTDEREGCEGPGQPDKSVKEDKVYGFRYGEKKDKLRKL